MSRLLCDAGVWIAALRSDDDFHEPCARLIDSCAGRDDALAALDLTLYEVANVAIMRTGSAAMAEMLTGMLRRAATGAIVSWNPEMLAAAAALAAARGLTVYDAAYVATAQGLGWTLVSTDIRDLVEPGFAISPDQVVT